jgi:DNA-binding NarL/FixJ family response regulator
MTKNIPVESSDADLFDQTHKNEFVATVIEQEIHEPASLIGNDIAKREMAIELLQQGLSEEAVCRILNISHDLLLEPLPF